MAVEPDGGRPETVEQREESADLKPAETPAAPEPSEAADEAAPSEEQPLLQTDEPAPLAPPAPQLPATPTVSAPPPLPAPAPPTAANLAAEPSSAEAPVTAAAPSAPPPPAPTPPPAVEAVVEAVAAAETPPAPAAGGAHLMPGLPDASQPADADDEADDLPMEAMLGELEPEPSDLREGDRRIGVVVSVSADALIVDIGGKTEGALSLRDRPEGQESPKLETGDEIEVVVRRLGGPGEYVQLAPAHEERSKEWDAVEAAFEAKQPVTAKIIERVKGGLSVDVGVPAFLPGSQVGLQPLRNLDELISTEMTVAIVKLSRKRGNVVVSRRQLLEDEVNELKKETLAKLSKGSVVTGKVKNVTSYGAFVDLGGVDGLVHVTDISYGRIKDPSEALQPGQEITAKVIKFDPEKERVSLSLKHMEPDPWERVHEGYHEGQLVKGKVASVTDYGAFVELEPGVEGLIHITELTWSRRLKHPSKTLKPDDEIESVVLAVQPAARRISLSVKRLQPDPWELVAQQFKTGSIVEGVVRNVTTYGAFVEIGEGVDGLIHASDLSWDTRVRNPKDLVRKGQPIQAVVLEVDAGQRRMSLGVKQLQPDVWETYCGTHGVGDKVIGRASRQAKFGAFVELAPGVDGLCHNSEIPRRQGGKARTGLQTGREYQFEILRLDELQKKIALRCLGDAPQPEPPAPKRPKAAPATGETDRPAPEAAPTADAAPAADAETAPPSESAATAVEVEPAVVSDKPSTAEATAGAAEPASEAVATGDTATVNAEIASTSESVAAALEVEPAAADDEPSEPEAAPRVTPSEPRSEPPSE